MPRAFGCPDCGATVTTYMRAGEQTRCAQCDAISTVPDAAEEVAAVVPPRPAAALPEVAGGQPRGRARLNAFDKICAALALAMGCWLLLTAVISLVWIASGRAGGLEIYGVVFALPGWGVVRAVTVAWTARRPPSMAELDEVFD